MLLQYGISRLVGANVASMPDELTELVDLPTERLDVEYKA